MSLSCYQADLLLPRLDPGRPTAFRWGTTWFNQMFLRHEPINPVEIGGPDFRFGYFSLHLQ